jgi:Spy/CpxP family protein refolding chaperone
VGPNGFKRRSAMKKIQSLRIVRSMPILGLLAIFILSGGCSTWHSQPMEKKATKIANRISKKLDLTESQKAELNQIKDEIVGKIKSKENVEKRKELRTAFFEMFKGDSMTKENLKDLYQKKEGEDKEMREFLMDKLVQFHKMLTPEQRTKVEEWMEKFARKFEEG